MVGYILQGELTVDYGDLGVKKFSKGDSLVEAVNHYTMEKIWETNLLKFLL